MKKVMIVDDEAFIRNGIRNAINWNELGCEVTGTYRNGKEVQNALAEKETDIIISDIRMPKMDGLELLSWVQAEYPEICFIIVSGYDDFSYAQQAINHGAFGYLLKPIVIEELENMVRRAVYQLSPSGNGEEGPEIRSSEYNEPNNAKEMFGDDLRKIVEQAKQIARENLGDKDLSLEMIAKRLGYNVTYFSHVFSSIEGQGFSNYLTNCRMELARRLLTETDKKVQEIAALTGYSNQPYFSTKFRAETGLTPSEYKEKYTKKSK